jgi:hypothetical protein
VSRLISFEPGQYQFLEGGFPYSAGVVAMPGSHMVRARFHRPPNVAEGFAAIAAHLGALGRPLTALCAVELRSPRPFTLSGFKSFNEGYVEVLKQWGLFRDGLNPVARSNVCPVFDAPGEPVFYAFSYTVSHGHPAAVQAAAGLDYVVAGSGEWPEHLPFPEGIIARGDLSASGLAAKVAYVIDTMKARCLGLGADWTRLSASQIYTAENFYPLLASHFAASGLTAAGLTWHCCKPPIIELEFEMDLRSLANEGVLF